MSRPHARTLWFWTVGVVALSIAIAALIDIRVATGLLLSFYSGEVAIVYWVGVLGMPVWAATGIAILCGTIDLAGWFFLAQFAEGRLRRFFEKRSRPSPRGRLVWLASKAPYVALPFFGLVPGSIQAGVVVSRVFQVPHLWAFCLISIGNVGKMVISGSGVGLLKHLLS